MAREGTGTIAWCEANPVKGETQGHWKVRITVQGGRPWIHCDPSPRSKQTEDRAREKAKHWTERAKREGLTIKDFKTANRRPPPSSSSTTEDKWFNAWIAERKAKGLTSAGDNVSHWKEHIRDVLGPDVTRWTSEDLRRLCRVLDEKVRAGDMRWKTALNVWATARKICSDACGSKVDALRVRTDNPAASVPGPDRGEETAKQYIFPSEFLRFAECAEVPLAWRRLVAVAIYTYTRAGELRALRWEDVDLEHGTMHVHRAAERGTSKDKGTKTGSARRFSIEPNLRPLLEAMHKESGGRGHVIPMQSVRTMARALRRWLLRAGVKRTELHVATPTRKQITFHDLRATACTWMAIRGDDPLRIQQRAGHEDFDTTQIYVREAEPVREGFGSPFPPLPASLLTRDAVAEAQSTNPEDGIRLRDSSSVTFSRLTARNYSGVDGTRTRGLRRDRPAL